MRDALDVLIAKGKLRKDDDLKVVVSGDGAAHGIGLQSTLAAVHRGLDFYYLCYDNEAFANTGFQMSPASPLGSRTATTPPSVAVPAGTSGRKQDLFDHIRIRAVDALFQRGKLCRIVSDGGDDASNVRVLLEDGPERGRSSRSRIDDLRGARRPRRHVTGTVRHAAVRDRRPVFDDENPAPAHRGRIVEMYGRRRPHDRRPRIDAAHFIDDAFDMAAARGARR